MAPTYSPQGLKLPLILYWINSSWLTCNLGYGTLGDKPSSRVHIAECYPGLGWGSGLGLLIRKGDGYILFILFKELFNLFLSLSYTNYIRYFWVVIPHPLFVAVSL
jgi:hypothetical protein